MLLVTERKCSWYLGRWSKIVKMRTGESVPQMPSKALLYVPAKSVEQANENPCVITKCS